MHAEIWAKTTILLFLGGLLRLQSPAGWGAQLPED